MDKGLMKFGNVCDRYTSGKITWQHAEPCKDTHWLANKVENRNSDEVVAYLEKGFTKDEQIFKEGLFDEEKVNFMDKAENTVQRGIHINYPISEVAYFYGYFVAMAWFDEKDNEWIWSGS